MEGSGVRQEVREARMGGGVIRYRDVGTGPVLFFVHGILVNGTLWRNVVARPWGHGGSREEFSGD
ncbi:hypothetical protein BH18ACT11_BH18ACT11_08830 [soil metagenome]